MKSSIVSYPERGHWGNNRYRGNASGHLYQDLYRSVGPELVIDPCQGSGTSIEAAQEMGIEAVGLDLHSGFNILTDSIAEQAGRCGDLVISHFPYHDMIVYSGQVYNGAHQDDLSRCTSVEDFVEKCHVALLNQREATVPGGYYATLIGDHRKNGEYRSYQADFIARMPESELQSVIIKAQHNVMSDGRDYGSRFGSGLPRIMHEYLLVWRKPQSPVSVLVTLGEMARKAYRQLWSSWKAVVHQALIQLGGQAPLARIYEYVENLAADRTNANANWKAKVRQVLQKGERFEPVERGVWGLTQA